MADLDPGWLDSLKRYEFLSSQWLEEFHAVSARLGADQIGIEPAVKLNQVVSGCPFQAEPLRAYLSTVSGYLEIGIGEIENPDLTVALDYETAKLLFVDLDPRRAVEAFLGGKVLVTGDMTKLLGLAQALASRGPGDPLGEALKAITS